MHFFGRRRLLITYWFLLDIVCCQCCTDTHVRDNPETVLINQFAHGDFLLRQFEFHVKTQYNQQNELSYVARLRRLCPKYVEMDGQLEPWSSYTVVSDGTSEQLLTVSHPWKSTTTSNHQSQTQCSTWHHFSSALQFHEADTKLYSTEFRAENVFGYKHYSLVGYLPGHDAVVYCGGFKPVGPDRIEDLNHGCMMYNRSQPDQIFDGSHKIVFSQVSLTPVNVFTNALACASIPIAGKSFCRSVVAADQFHIFCFASHFVFGVQPDGTMYVETSLPTFDAVDFISYRMMYGVASYGTMIIVCGGKLVTLLDETTTTTTSCLTFDTMNPDEGWLPVASMNRARHDFTIVVVGELGFLAIGGKDEFDRPCFDAEFLPFGNMKHWIVVTGSQFDTATDQTTFLWVTEPRMNHSATSRSPLVRYLTLQPLSLNPITMTSNNNEQTFQATITSNSEEPPQSNKWQTEHWQAIEVYIYAAYVAAVVLLLAWFTAPKYVANTLSNSARLLLTKCHTLAQSCQRFLSLLSLSNNDRLTTHENLRCQRRGSTADAPLHETSLDARQPTTNYSFNDFVLAVQNGVAAVHALDYDKATAEFEQADMMRTNNSEIMSTIDVRRDFVPFLYTFATVLLNNKNAAKYTHVVSRLIAELESTLGVECDSRFPLLYLLRARQAIIVNSYTQCVKHCERGLDDICGVRAANFVSVVPVVKYPFSTNLPRNKKIIPESRKPELQKEMGNPTHTAIRSVLTATELYFRDDLNVWLLEHQPLDPVAVGAERKNVRENAIFLRP